MELSQQCVLTAAGHRILSCLCWRKLSFSLLGLAAVYEYVSTVEIFSQRNTWIFNVGDSEVNLVVQVILVYIPPLDKKLCFICI